MNVLIFKTSAKDKRDLKKIEPLLNSLITINENWNFDLEDCDHILRVEAISVQASDIIKNIQKAGFYCAELEDYIPA